MGIFRVTNKRPGAWEGGCGDYELRGGGVARLTEKQKRFVAEYLVDLNATQAAIRAGYKEKTAGSIGNENLKKPEIQAAIHEAMVDRQARTEITQDRVLEELAAIGFSKATDYAQIRGPLVDLTPTEELTEKQKRAIASIEQGNFGIKLKLHDKVRALELLGKHVGLFDSKSGQATTSENNLLDVIKSAGEINTDDLPEVE